MNLSTRPLKPCSPWTWARQTFKQLSPKQRQYTVLIALFGGGVAALWLVLLFSMHNEPSRPAAASASGPKTVTNLGVMPPGQQVNPVDQWVGTAGQKLAQYESERDEQTRLNKDRQAFEARTMQRFSELEQRLMAQTQAQAQSNISNTPNTGLPPASSLPLPHSTNASSSPTTPSATPPAPGTSPLAPPLPRQPDLYPPGQPLQLEVRIQGSIFGEDGKVGMRGRLITKQGQILANALLAGVVGGIGQGVSTSSSSYNTSILGTVSNASGSDALRGGVGAGVGRALDRLAQYHIKLAENTFPVIEVDAGREIDVVITQGVRIDQPQSTWQSSLSLTQSDSPRAGREPAGHYLENLLIRKNLT